MDPQLKLVRALKKVFLALYGLFASLVMYATQILSTSHLLKYDYSNNKSALMKTEAGRKQEIETTNHRPIMLC